MKGLLLSIHPSVFLEVFPSQYLTLYLLILEYSVHPFHWFPSPDNFTYIAGITNCEVFNFSLTSVLGFSNIRRTFPKYL